MSGKTRIRESRPKPPLSRSPVPAKRSTEEPAAATLDTAEAIRQTATSPLSGRRPENILALQQTLGNSAVQRLLARKRGSAGTAISPSPGPRQIQRNGDPPPEGAEGLSPEQMKKQKASIEKQVKGLPSLDDRVPSESAVKSAQKEGEAQGKEVEKLVEKGGPEMAAFLHAEMNPLGASGGGGAPAPEQSEAPPASAPGPAPASAQQPEKGGKKKPYGKQKSRGAGRHDKGATGSEGVGWVEQVVETSVDIAQQAGKLGSKAADVAGKVLGWIGAVFGAISAALDIRAIASSAKKAKDLKQVLKEGRARIKGQAAGKQEEELLDAVEYAMDQKYTKVFKRSLTLVGTLLSTGVGIAALCAGVSLLASNPVGWTVAACIAAVGIGIGLGALLYKIGRAIYKKIMGTKGKLRGQMAQRLFDHAIGGGNLKDIAQKAIDKLGLSSKKIQDEYDEAGGKKSKVEKTWVGLIKRKMASS